MSDTTRIRSIDPDEPDPELLEEAAEILRSGGLVAFATETVYGLGADATQPEAVARIFKAKGRPANNPLIVHADGLEMARRCVLEWPETAQRLAERFWPGPLTLVLPRSAIIPEIVSAGLETVGVRVPAPAVARGLITRLGRPVAAPSANRSNRISPTQAQHVFRDLEGQIPLILDSGPTRQGLESTVVKLTGKSAQILRPGPITSELIEHVLGFTVTTLEDLSFQAPSDRPDSPGQLAVHYAPRTLALRVDRAELKTFRWPDRAALLVLGHPDLPLISGPSERIDLPNASTAAQQLFARLHQLDEAGLDLIVVVPPPDGPEWRAIRDRIQRATRPATLQSHD